MGGFRRLVYDLLEFIDPSIQVGRRTRMLRLQSFASQVLMQLDIEQLQEIGFLVGQSTVDLNKIRVSFFEQRVNEGRLPGCLLSVENKRSIGPDQPLQHFPLRQHKR